MSIYQHNHDYAHCNQELCERKEQCLRYVLFQEDKRFESSTGLPSYCSYLIISQNESKSCTAFVAAY